MANDRNDELDSPPDLVDLTGSVALVTGAASGLGRASAELLGAAGATVVCADLNPGGATDTATSITSAGGAAVAHGLDVTDREAVDGLVSRIVRDHGQLDICCNIAGILPPKVPMVDLTEGELDLVLGVNLKGVFFGAAAAARVMVSQGRGTIINFASAAIDMPAVGLGAYAISKVGVAQLSRTLALEVAPHGVRVNTVAPGFVSTALTDGMFRREDGSIDEEARERATAAANSAAPLGRAAPRDVARAVLYLASPASSFVTGQVIRPNGGVTMP